MNNEIYDVIILGAGPAGLAAGIYASRAKLSTLIINEGAVGGQLTLTEEIANYPGVETTSGYQLVTTMKKQAQEFGCKIKSNRTITRFQLEGAVKSITVNDTETFQGRTVILATGGTPRMLGIPGEQEFKGRGVSYCATCDGDFFNGKEIVVVGGGNSALEEAVTLTKHASKVTIVHQFDQFQAFEYAIEEAKANPKIEFIMESELRAIVGADTVEKIEIEHLPTGNKSELKTDGIFVFIGYVPNTEKVKDVVMVNERGEILVDPEMKTNTPGVFGAGDSIQKRYRQVTTAVADGTIAALSASAYLRQ
ncbi:MAG TPA: thioredoxin-disulfide reductase [Marinilabiliales bacterium]|nr:MAG: thioredoxin-disulfide reductase [Bacteroidetes bacterium GWC2_40_13]OFX73690.1 MAG: thioredoxin-disulfide reductase [Bacteroidetes bacterium GWD2_40_43]OFX89246.1 MAG: thioredoxin-disulfide reductase [Bacteroidetes bacterium GWE2_40_63]OFY23872.1 MAG: thioredoxin-disulfide reductase [Bacteroidetes bacterium GWF2_40_13]OFZ32245.1 MAG: thioredoxin-disulfide reductase [Bacteroidetes bacterium RIFOXYC2_FULL_40_12]HAM97591.1 thioredoxin-disulfide reductase [Marinilabiliales bacterium]